MDIVGVTRVLIIDPGKKPEFKEVYLDKSMLVSLEDTGELVVSTYRVAKKLLCEYYGIDDGVLVQRVHENEFKFISMYVDEDCRIKHVKANRNIIFQNHQMMPIAGRVVVLPDLRSMGEIYLPKDPLLFDAISEEFNRFIATNSDDGLGPISYLSQEESDMSLGEGWEAIAMDEDYENFLNSIFKHMREE